MGRADMARVPHVVADTGAFLSAAPLQDIAENLYTVPETGDYPSLSAADLQVLALTCQLQTETDGPGCLRWEPQDKVQLSSTPRHPEAPLHVAGFHLPAKHKSPEKGQHQPSPDGSTIPSERDEFSSFLYWRVPLPSIEEELQELLKPPATPISTETAEEQQSSEDEASAEEEEDEEESDSEGWITPSNLKQAQQDMGHCDTAPVGIQVGCVTTDFAMQNVLLQMGLHVLAVNGRLIRQARSYILRCHGCFKTTSDMTKVFCPNCGNKTLKKYPLPAPRGGKHANNPHLVEDQPFPQQRLSRKARQKTNVFDPDYIAGISPFAENDVYSRAANLQIRDAALGAGRRRLNPNAVTKKFVKRR
ncbi:RNA-binding protein NOB1 [Patagioenas fasciata monilis]|uniref:RNA-binding protein NOB1 n=1 Tax=Patagioenas fasciata monilis TaxID=372326 RepID=A0A1V4K355_PATFA|nr:RNA-binding protein NOB1 [Patagioenas fasciata monilis]